MYLQHMHCWGNQTIVAKGRGLKNLKLENVIWSVYIKHIFPRIGVVSPIGFTPLPDS